ncbi:MULTISPECIES: hypothetical protein [Ensifer]|uniref:hypothetical protein n=1 Tax=Ensifer TaxID=106591 RepID=UPI00159EC2DF|nr:hypothetical protein [Ensifer adhaerens]
MNMTVQSLQRQLIARQDREMEILNPTSEISSVRSDVDEVKNKHQSLDSRVSAE